MDHLVVKSIKYSLQLDGPFQGWPAVIVEFPRLMDYSSFPFTPVYEIVEHIIEQANGKTKFVVLTGGEPFHQDILPLILSLDDNHFTLQVDTDGTVSPLDKGDVGSWRDAFIVCSPKTPTIDPWIETNLFALKYEIKAGNVGEDGLPFGLGIYHPFLHYSGVDIYVSPMEDRDPELYVYNTRAAEAVALRYGYRLSIPIKLSGVNVL